MFGYGEKQQPAATNQLTTNLPTYRTRSSTRQSQWPQITSWFVGGVVFSTYSSSLLLFCFFFASSSSLYSFVSMAMMMFFFGSFLLFFLCVFLLVFFLSKVEVHDFYYTFYSFRFIYLKGLREIWCNELMLNVVHFHTVSDFPQALIRCYPFPKEFLQTFTEQHPMKH